MSASVEEVYRIALQLSPEERRQLVQELSDSPSGLTTDSIIRALNAQASKLRELGVRRIGVFGSHARGDARLDSDIDILVEMADEHYTLFELLDVRFHLQEIFGRGVDAVPADSIRPEFEQLILQEVVYAEGL